MRRLHDVALSVVVEGHLLLVSGSSWLYLLFGVLLRLSSLPEEEEEADDKDSPYHGTNHDTRNRTLGELVAVGVLGPEDLGFLEVGVQFGAGQLVRRTSLVLADIDAATPHEGGLDEAASPPLVVGIATDTQLRRDQVVGGDAVGGVSETLAGAVSVGCFARVDGAAPDELDLFALADVKGTAIVGRAAGAHPSCNLDCWADHGSVVIVEVAGSVVKGEGVGESAVDHLSTGQWTIEEARTTEETNIKRKGEVIWGK